MNDEQRLELLAPLADLLRKIRDPVNPADLKQTYRQFHHQATPDMYAALLGDEDDGLALQAAYELRLRGRRDSRSSDPGLAAAWDFWFIGFATGRLAVDAPHWWLAGFVDTQPLNATCQVLVAANGDAGLELMESGYVMPQGSKVRVTDSNVIVTLPNVEEVRLPATAVNFQPKKRLLGTLTGIQKGRIAFIYYRCVNQYNNPKGHLFRIDLECEQPKWEAETWFVNRIGASWTGLPDAGNCELRCGHDQNVYVFGDPWMARSLDVFRQSDGASVFRFTDELSSISLA